MKHNQDDPPADAISRRRFVRGVGGFSAVTLAGGGLVGGGASYLMPPEVRGGLMGVADVLTMASQRLLMAGQPLAQEHDPRDITKNFPTWGQTNPRDEEYQRLASDDFADYRLGIEGLVNRPTSLSLDQIKSLPRRTQITAHICEQGWSAIGEWTGAPLLEVLGAAGGVKPEARYVVLTAFDRWYESYDMFDVVHPQTILAYGLNGRDLPRGNGAPVRLRVERQCGYKHLKFVRSIAVVESVDDIRGGSGGINSDNGFHWYAGA
jgi:DMSO/TMAO reductase YedYZ molybdopterin-dependent catalytic subunit